MLLHRYRSGTDATQCEEDVEKAFQTLDLFCVGEGAKTSLEVCIHLPCFEAHVRERWFNKRLPIRKSPLLQYQFPSVGLSACFLQI